MSSNKRTSNDCFTGKGKRTYQSLLVKCAHKDVFEVTENGGEGVLVNDEGQPVRLGDQICRAFLARHDRALAGVPARSDHRVLVLDIPRADVGNLDLPFLFGRKKKVCA